MFCDRRFDRQDAGYERDLAPHDGIVLAESIGVDSGFVGRRGVILLKQLQKGMTHRIVFWLAQTRSVLGGIEYHTDGRWFAAKVMLLTLPITGGTYYLDLLLYTGALLATARVLTSIIEGAPTNLRGLVGAISSAGTRALLFCVALLGLLALAWLFLMATTGLLQWPHKIGVFANPLTAYVYASLLSVAIAYLIGPSAITLLRNNSEQTTSEEAKGSRLFSVVAVAVSACIAFAGQHAGQSLIDAPPHLHGFAILGLDLLASLLAAGPYILLFIALSLIARTAPNAMEEPVAEVY